MRCAGDGRTDGNARFSLAYARDERGAGAVCGGTNVNGGVERGARGLANIDGI